MFIIKTVDKVPSDVQTSDTMIISKQSGAMFLDSDEKRISLGGVSASSDYSDMSPGGLEFVGRYNIPEENLGDPSGLDALKNSQNLTACEYVGKTSSEQYVAVGYTSSHIYVYFSNSRDFSGITSSSMSINRIANGSTSSNVYKHPFGVSKLCTNLSGNEVFYIIDGMVEIQPGSSGKIGDLVVSDRWDLYEVEANSLNFSQQEGLIAFAAKHTSEGAVVRTSDKIEKLKIEYDEYHHNIYVGITYDTYSSASKDDVNTAIWCLSEAESAGGQLLDVQRCDMFFLRATESYNQIIACKEGTDSGGNWGWYISFYKHNNPTYNSSLTLINNIRVGSSSDGPPDLLQLSEDRSVVLVSYHPIESVTAYNIDTASASSLHDDVLKQETSYIVLYADGINGDYYAYVYTPLGEQTRYILVNYGNTCIASLLVAMPLYGLRMMKDANNESIYVCTDRGDGTENRFKLTTR